MERTHKKAKRKKIRKRTVIVNVFCIAVVVILISIFAVAGTGKKKETQIITKSNLEKIINVSDLSTLEAVYNGVAKVPNEENPDEIDYYVSYDAKVKAGINFNEIKIDVDNEKKAITVTLPEIKINDVNVDITSLDYIFLNNKANTETVSEQAYKKCIDDVTNETNTEDQIYKLAKENAENIIEALIKPFVNQLDSEYSLTID